MKYCIALGFFAIALLSCQNALVSTDGVKAASPTSWQGVEDKQWNIAVNHGSMDTVGGVVSDSQGYVYVGGSSNGLVTSLVRSWWLKKYDSNGNEVRFGWDKRISQTNGLNDCLYALAVGPDDSVYAGGSFDTSSSTVPRNLIKRYKPDGTEMLSILITNAAGSISALAVDSNNTVYFCTTGGNLGAYSSNGTPLWCKQLSVNNITANIFARCLSLDQNQNVIVGGSGRNLVSADSNYDSWYQRYSPTGDRTFENVFSANGSGAIGAVVYTADNLNAIAVDKNGNIFTAGNGYGITKVFTTTGAGTATATACQNYVPWIRGFTASGAPLLDKRLPTRDTFDALINSMCLDQSGNIFVTGIDTYNASSTMQNLFVKKFNQSGEELWSSSANHANNYDPSSDCLALTPNQSLIVVSTEQNLFSAVSGDDWWIRRFY